MSVPSASNAGSYPLPAYSQQPLSAPNSPPPSYSLQAPSDQPDLFSPPPYSASPNSTNPASSNMPIPPGPGASAAKPGMGMGGLILAGVAGILGYFAGKNILKSHPVIGGLVGAAVAAIAGFIGWGFFAGGPKQPPQA